MAEKISGPGSMWTGQINAAIPRILGVQSSDGHWGFLSTCGGSWNFMTGMLTDVLSRMYDQRGDNGGSNPAILAALTKAGNYLWDTQWRGGFGDPSFNYASLLCLDAGSPSSAPDLNGLILPVYGWLGKKTGDASWFSKGDAILSGMTGADVELYKQFSESYTSSYGTSVIAFSELIDGSKDLTDDVCNSWVARRAALTQELVQRSVHGLDRPHVAHF